jgi:imidazolonepropionase-like amidohydrolase
MAPGAPRSGISLVIKGGRIISISPASQVTGAHKIDARGKTIMPGLINAHGHLGLLVDGQNRADAFTKENVQKQLLQYEAYGVTSMLSLGLNRDVAYEWREEQKHGAFPGASFFTAGRGIGAAGGAPALPVAPDQLYRPTAPEEARTVVREMAAHQADIIKMWVDDSGGKLPKITHEIYTAVIDETHKLNLRAAAHVYYLADAKSLVSAGVDALAHSIRDKPVDSELIHMMKSRHVWYIPTLTVDESFFAFADDPALLRDPFFAGAVRADARKRLDSDEYRNKVNSDANTPRAKAALAVAMRNLKALHDAGVQIAFGTDSGANGYRIPGWAEHRELELITRAGLTPMSAIITATRGSAAFLQVTDRGTLESGKLADFLILADDPLQNIRNSRQIVSIWHAGKQVEPRVSATTVH